MFVLIKPFLWKTAHVVEKKKLEEIIEKECKIIVVIFNIMSLFLVIIVLHSLCKNSESEKKICFCLDFLFISFFFSISFIKVEKYIKKVS